MKIIFLSAYYPPETIGGAEISTHLLARGLANLRQQVTVITPGVAQSPTVIDGVKIIKIPLPWRHKPLFEQRHSLACARFLQRLSPILSQADIIHAHDFRSTLTALEWKRKYQVHLPIIATIRDYAQISGSTNFINSQGELPANSLVDASTSHRIKEAGPFRRIFRWWQYRYNVPYRQTMFRRLDSQVFISKAQRRLTSRHQDLNHLATTVIYNPLANRYLTTAGKDGHDGLVLYVGRVERYKGLDLLLSAWPTIAQAAPLAHLKIVGSGADKDRYENMVANNNNLRYKVSFAGQQPWSRLMPIYDQAQIVVAPHLWYEPFGRAVAEAMARGKVVVTANVGGPAEIITPSQSGLLFTHNSRSSLISTMRQALAMNRFQRRQMGGKAHTWAKKNLAAATITAQYQQCYAAVLQQNQSHRPT